MQIGTITIQPTGHRPDWDDPLCQKGYMPRMIPDWSRNVRVDIELSGTREEWSLLGILVGPHASYLAGEIMLTQHIIDRLSEVGVSQEKIGEIQRIFGEMNEDHCVCS